MGQVVFGAIGAFYEKGEITMRNVVLVLVLGLSAAVWAVNGDMGVGTEPLTDGSAAYPWLIEDLADFDVFAGDSAYWAGGVHTQLMTDIDLSGRTYTTAVIAPDTSASSGFQGVFFQGDFDGNSHIIRNLIINNGNNGNDYLGLFGRINGLDSEVKDLDIVEAHITANSYSDYVGGGMWI